MKHASFHAYMYDIHTCAQTHIHTCKPYGQLQGPRAGSGLMSQLFRVSKLTFLHKPHMFGSRYIQSGKPVFGSVAAGRYGRTVPFCEEIKERPDTRVVHLKPSTRSEVMCVSVSVCVSMYVWIHVRVRHSVRAWMRVWHSHALFSVSSRRV